MRAVRRAEGLVDVVVEALDQRRAEHGVVGLLAGMEAQVLQQLDVATEFVQSTTHRFDAVALDDLAVGTTEVRAGHEHARRARAVPRRAAAWRGCESRR